MLLEDSALKAHWVINALFFFTGEPRKYDPTFKGPIQNRWDLGVIFTKTKRVQRGFFNPPNFALSISRGCTDIVCCILFILAILAYIAVGILGKETELQFGLTVKTKNLPIKIQLFVTSTFFCAPSLVPGWPQEGDLSHRQSRPVLRAGWHPTWVSCFACIYVVVKHFCLTLRTRTHTVSCCELPSISKHITQLFSSTPCFIHKRLWFRVILEQLRVSLGMMSSRG